MRRILRALGLLASIVFIVGCEHTVAVRGTVTAPPEIQAMFSADRPGVVWVEARIPKTGTIGGPLGLLCAPSEAARVLEYVYERFGCAKEAVLRAWVVPVDDNAELSCANAPAVLDSQLSVGRDGDGAVADAEAVLFRGNEPGWGCSSGEDQFDVTLAARNPS